MNGVLNVQFSLRNIAKMQKVSQNPSLFLKMYVILYYNKKLMLRQMQ